MISIIRICICNHLNCNIPNKIINPFLYLEIEQFSLYEEYLKKTILETLNALMNKMF